MLDRDITIKETEKDSEGKVSYWLELRGSSHKYDFQAISLSATELKSLKGKLEKIKC